MRDGMNLRRLPDRLVRLQTPLRVDEVGGEDSVDECRLSQASLTCCTHFPSQLACYEAVWVADTHQRR